MSRNCVHTEAVGLNTSKLCIIGAGGSWGCCCTHILRPFSLSSSLHKRLAQAAWGEDLCQSILIDKWKPPAPRLGGTFWSWEPLDKDIWASSSCPGSDPSSIPNPAMCNRDRSSSWLLLAMDFRAQKGEMWGWSSRGNLALCGGGPHEHKVDKVAGASSCHASAEEQQHGAVPWCGTALRAVGHQEGDKEKTTVFPKWSILQLPVELPCKAMWGGVGGCAGRKKLLKIIA